MLLKKVSFLLKRLILEDLFDEYSDIWDPNFGFIKSWIHHGYWGSFINNRTKYNNWKSSNFGNKNAPEVESALSSSS